MNFNIAKFTTLVKYFAGFSVVGAIVTIASFFTAIFLIEFFKISILIVYPVVYISSLFVSYYLNKEIVFKYRGSKNKLLLYFTIYLTSMLLGFLLIFLMKEFTDIRETLIAILILPVTTTYNFILVYLLFNKQEKK